jgi:hypothetical protein
MAVRLCDKSLVDEEVSSAIVTVLYHHVVLCDAALCCMHAVACKLVQNEAVAHALSTLLRACMLGVLDHCKL